MIRCKICRQECNPDNLIYYNGKDVYFCSEQCFTSFLITEKEQEQRKELYGQICRIFNIREITPKLYSEVKRVKERLNLTYHNLSLVLHYMYDIKQIPIYSPTLFYVEQYVEEAKAYYKDIKLRQDRIMATIQKATTINKSKIIKPNYKSGKKNTGLKINPEEV